MKKLITIIFIGMCIHAHTQSIGIGATPDSSAVLDIRSFNKGILLPRVSLLSIYDSTTIKKPAVSLMVFNLNAALPNGLGFYAWTGKAWQIIISIANNYIKGKNRYTIMVDGDEREFWVSVPKSYDSTKATPMLIMLHGTSGNGEKFYEESGWKELGEDENIITVFPSSWRYKIIKPTENDTTITTKWNTTPDAEWYFYPGQTPRNDIKFLKTMIVAITKQLHIDTSRIYLEGFSNGGQMASKCAIEMSDILAAVVSNAGGFYLDTTYIPKRKLPVMYQIGNDDYGPGNEGPDIALSYFDSSLKILNPLRPARQNYNISRAYIRNFLLDSNYVLSGDTNSVMVASYQGTGGNPLNIYRHVFVKALGHKYPNGDNHWFDAPRTHWAWMKRFKLP